MPLPPSMVSSPGPLRIVSLPLVPLIGFAMRLSVEVNDPAGLGAASRASLALPSRCVSDPTVWSCHAAGPWGQPESWLGPEAIGRSFDHCWLKNHGTFRVLSDHPSVTIQNDSGSPKDPPADVAVM